MAEKKTAFELAKQYYPTLWDANRIDALYKAGKLTEEEYNKIINSKETESENP